MKHLFLLALLGSAFVSSTRAADLNPVAKVFDGQISTIDSEVLGLAQAMPAAKYDFAPTNGTFTGVRTFGMQVRHIATIMYMVSGAVLQAKPPVDVGASENGPDALKTKDQIIDYFKGALAFAHKAAASLTEKNLVDQVPSPFGDGTMTRLAAASLITYHSFDHYGQMVVYGRMNGVIPPASR